MRAILNGLDCVALHQQHMQQTPKQIFFRFLRFGFLAWGGPVAQISMIRKELVDEEKWVTSEQFNRALALYQVLPGPEAHELCVYFGMKAGGRWGGFLAGLAFMLPGFLLMLLLTWFYVQFGLQSPLIQTVFGGIQAAVIALILFAVYRIGKHSVVNYQLLIIALVSAMAFFIGVHFLLILLVAGFAYTFWQKKSLLITLSLALLLIGVSAYKLYDDSAGLTPVTTVQTTPTIQKKTEPAAVFVTGLKGGLLTFGGAYTAIPFIREDAVVKNGWMTQEQFLDGIALSGILPAPLIIFSTFVGYFGGGWLGAILITIGIFLPAFCFTLIGHTAMEKLIAHKALHNFLDGVTAGVVALIGVTALQLLISTITSLSAVIILVIALLTLIRYRSKYTVMIVIAGAGLFNLLWHYLPS